MRVGDRVIREFLDKYKKQIINILSIIIMLVAVSLVSLIILLLFDIIYFDDGMKLNVELFNSFRNSWYGWLIILAFQVVLTVLLCFIPGTSMAFIILMQALFDKPWHAFVLAFIGVLISSTFMYLVGRSGGYKICEKILGEKDCKKASELLNHRGAVYFPIMMLFPIFPDDALVMIAGTLKMDLKWFIPSIIFGRGIGVATIIFGLRVIPYDKFTTIWHWIAFILICAILIILVFYCAHKFNKFMENRHKK